MKLVAFTIVLNGEPFIERHLPVFQQLTIPWQWIVIEGVAGNTADTSWCQPQQPRLGNEPRWSNDGTSEYLWSIGDKRVEHWGRAMWENKTEMCNFALAGIKQPCLLMQIDADEIWRAEQLETIVRLFQDKPSLNSIMFACNYFVGPDLLLVGKDCYGDKVNEWLRAWRFTPGDYFISHEPPILHSSKEVTLGMSKEESRKLDLVFDHFPYVTEAQVAYKEKFYGYTGLLDQWRALQRNNEWPVPLSRFFTHVSGELPLVVKV